MIRTILLMSASALLALSLHSGPAVAQDVRPSGDSPETDATPARTSPHFGFLDDAFFQAYPAVEQDNGQAGGEEPAPPAPPYASDPPGSGNSSDVDAPGTTPDQGSATGLPRVDDYSNSGCLLVEGDPWPCEDDDVIELTVDGQTLHVLHTNANYNCCPDDIVISLDVDGDLLLLTEEEILVNPCYCICCYEVEATVVDLPPGTYTVEFCWFDYDTDEVECYVEDIVIPEGDEA